MSQGLAAGLNLKTIKPKEEELPSFAQFLEYIISDSFGGENRHWTTYHSTCQPCLLQYNAIIKLETADQDNEYVMQMSGLNNLTSYEKRHETKGGQSSAKDIRNKYFSQVKCSLLKKVYDYYALDFELFDYQPNEFYNICQP